MFKKELKRSVIVLVLLSLLTGVFYPLTVHLLAHLFFARKAKGSLVIRNGEIIGSTLIGQKFNRPEYFWGRPSATGREPYDASNSSGSNIGPAAPALVETVSKRITEIRGRKTDRKEPLPVDLVTASASGLDPDISPAAAYYQARRVAKARHRSEESIRHLIRSKIIGRTLGIIGEPRVNVLDINLALDHSPH